MGMRILAGAAIITVCMPLLFMSNLSLEDRVDSVNRDGVVSLPLQCSNISEYNMPDNWCLDSIGVPRFVGGYHTAPDTIQHYTHTGCERCLSGKTIVFVGDSRVRYQYLHLAAFLTLGRWMKCPDYKTINASSLPDQECFLIAWKTVKQMNSWFKQTADYFHLESNISSYVQRSQKSLCDCYRPYQFDPLLTYENRFIERVTPFGNINLIYLLSFLNKVRLSSAYPPFTTFSPTTKRCNPGECGPERTDAFEGNVNDTLWRLPQLNATHAFVSLGWEKDFTFGAVSDLACNIQEFERHYPDINVYLISHPPRMVNIANPTRVFDAKKLECDVKVLDRTSMTANAPSSWYIDGDHVWSILSEEYNHQLIESICPLVR